MACEFADLHDRVGRMRAMRAVSGSVVWPSARQFFYWRLRRRLVEEGLVKDLVAADGRSAAEARQVVRAWCTGEDQEVAVCWRHFQGLKNRCQWTFKGQGLFNGFWVHQGGFGWTS